MVSIAALALLGWSLGDTPLGAFLEGAPAIVGKTLGAVGLDLLPVGRLLRGDPPVTGSAALAWLLLGAAIVMRAPGTGRLAHASRLVVLIVVVLGALSVASWLPRVDQAPAPGPVRFAALMSPATAAGVTLVGLALLLSGSASRRAGRAALGLALAALLGGLLGLLGRLLRVEAVLGVAFYTGMALPSALALLAAAAAALLLQAQSGPARLLVGSSAAARFARRTLLGALLIPALLGWLGLRGYRAGLYDGQFGVAAGVFVAVVLLGALVWRNAATLQVAEEERQRAAQALRASEERYRLLFAKNPHPMWVFDVETLAFLEVNEAAQAHYGWSRDEFLGMTIADIRPPADLPALAAELDVERPDMRLGQVWRHRTKAGETIEVEISAQSIDFTGRRARLVLAEDVTERRRVEAVERRTRQLEQEAVRSREASRLKSEFLANMSHELRTPLNAIIGFAELMHEGKVGPLAAEHREYLGDILSSARHLLQLINDVLDLSKVEAGKMEFRPERVDLARLFGEARDLLRGLAAERRVHVEVEVDVGLGEVETDPAKLKQVLYNYLSNALKFTPEGGRVWARALPGGEQSFRVEIEDTGVGIAPEDVPRLFREFQQLEAGAAKRHQGTGLGLALTRRLVEAQGGEVGVESEPGRGSRFWAILPRTAGRAGAAAVAPPVSAAARSPRGPRILVVDDDDRDRAWLETLLVEMGYEVDLAASGGEAVERCAETAYQAITLDLLLPDESGWEVLKRIHALERNRTTPVIVVSVVREKAAGRGFAIHDFLVKPLRPEDLLASLARARVLPGELPVLVVEDDPAALRLAQTALASAGYTVVMSRSAEEGLGLAAERRPAAVVLDLALPGMDGFAFLARLRRLAGGARVPVIVWTVRDLSAEEEARLAASAQAVVLKGQGGAAALLAEVAAWAPPPGASMSGAPR